MIQWYLSYWFQVTRKEKKPSSGLKSSSDDVPSYILDLFPPITVHNYLPYDVVYSMKVRDIESCVVIPRRLVLIATTSKYFFFIYKKSCILVDSPRSWDVYFTHVCLMYTALYLLYPSHIYM